MFDFNVNHDGDWFIHLISKDKELELGIGIGIGIIDRNNDIVPKDIRNNSQGFYVTFVVDNADEIFQIAELKKFETISESAAKPYVKRRLLLKDPNESTINWFC